MPHNTDSVADTPAPAAPASHSGNWKRRGRRFAFLLSLLLWLFFAFCYVVRPDVCTAVTVWPVWIWPLPGLLFATLACSRKDRRPLKRGVLLWLVFVLIFAEEPRSLVRFGAWPTTEWETARKQKQAIRVASINCAWGQKDAALETKPFQPDIVLLQETPQRQKVAEVAQSLFGSEGNVSTGIDASIIVHGTLLPTKLPRRTGFFTQARVKLYSGQEIEVISAHIITPPFRTDLWNPDCWRAYYAHRQYQRSQMQIIARQIAAVPAKVPVIVGGDFNMPQGDAVCRLLQPRLRDTFPEAGKGWGNTIVNDIPALRIDQIWVSKHFHPTTVFARKTVNSDHRMVLCDLIAQP